MNDDNASLWLAARFQLLKRRRGNAVPSAEKVDVSVLPAGTTEFLDCVIIGTSSLCNASCIHCPTNKPDTEHLPQGAMLARSFQPIIDQLAEGYRVGRMHFGLHGDPLTDPNIVERVLYARAKLPGTVLNIATNGAAYSPPKHAPLIDAVDYLSLHVESLDPMVYNIVMAPLRLERVLAKLEMIVRDFSSKVHQGKWSELSTCKTCLWDSCLPDTTRTYFNRTDAAASGVSAQQQRG